MDSFLLDDYAQQNGIYIQDNIPFDDIFFTEFNEELSRHKEIMDTMVNKYSEEVTEENA